MPVALDITTKGVKSAADKLKQKEKEAEKAQDTALKVVGYRLFRQMVREIKRGSPGGRRFFPLSYIARGARTRRKPFTGLHSTRGAGVTSGTLPVRYGVEDSRRGAKVFVGFPTSGRFKLSRRWLYLIEQLQAGFKTTPSSEARRYFARRGAELGPRTRRRRYYFFRKDRHTHETPARPIVDPFWDRYRDKTARDIPELIKRKMRGERI